MKFMHERSVHTLPCSPKNFCSSSLKCSLSVAIPCTIPSWAAGQPHLQQRISNETRSGTKSVKSLSRLPSRSLTPGSPILWRWNTIKQIPENSTLAPGLRRSARRVLHDYRDILPGKREVIHWVDGKTDRHEERTLNTRQGDSLSDRKKSRESVSF